MIKDSPADTKQTMLLVGWYAVQQERKGRLAGPSHLLRSSFRHPFASVMTQTYITLMWLTQRDLSSSRNFLARLSWHLPSLPKSRVGSTRENRNLAWALSAWLGGGGTSTYEASGAFVFRVCVAQSRGAFAHVQGSAPGAQGGFRRSRGPWLLLQEEV